MKTLLSILACALAVLPGSESLSEAQTKKQRAPVGGTDKKSKIVAVNTNEREEFPVESGAMKLIASSELSARRLVPPFDGSNRA